MKNTRSANTSEVPRVTVNIWHASLQSRKMQLEAATSEKKAKYHNSCRVDPKPTCLAAPLSDDTSCQVGHSWLMAFFPIFKMTKRRGEEWEESFSYARFVAFSREDGRLNNWRGRGRLFDEFVLRPSAGRSKSVLHSFFSDETLLLTRTKDESG
ncbi:unnamed protein product [Nesidiocoris tenuis]|uniref:Uncharacterized protein n=1 Tax=Nesidiocoris tenuis TaxID=355587 RepID=A0A6H5G4C9_9HEMI|nr:unnamed protein product [Nesidiocoris tenuis]